MTKNIIILGPSRAGKTTLAYRLNRELNYSVIPTDDIGIAFEEGMPQANINTAKDYKTSVANIASWLATYVSALAWRSNFYNGTKYVFDDGKGFFDFDQIVPIWEVCEPNKDYWKDQYLIIGLTCHNQTAEELFAKIRKHDTKDDWTSRSSDEELRAFIDENLDYSRSLHAKLEKYNPLMYDVSHSRNDVFDKIIRDIKTKGI